MPFDISGDIEQVKDWRENGGTIVFTNGCFDILHHGHTEFLKEAKSLGDRLVVGLNSDRSVSRIKGPGRPVNNLESRSEVLRSLRSVDLVIPFSEDDPLNLIMQVKPNILVKGGDYRSQNIVGSKFVISQGGKVKILKFVDGYSTTELISRIKKI